MVLLHVMTPLDFPSWKGDVFQRFQRFRQHCFFSWDDASVTRGASCYPIPFFRTSNYVCKSYQWVHLTSQVFHRHPENMREDLVRQEGARRVPEPCDIRIGREYHLPQEYHPTRTDRSVIVLFISFEPA